MYTFYSSKRKMMMRGDFDPIPVHDYTDSVKEVLKQTMLNQDFLFRSQVNELHRLYRVQESLMKDFGWEECNFSSWNPKLQSSQLPFTNSTRHEFLAKETPFFLTSEAKLVYPVGSTPFVGQEILRDRMGHNHRPLDLQLSTKGFIDLTEDNVLDNKKAQNCFKEIMDFKIPLSECNSSDAEELKLSLKLGGEDRRMVGTMGTGFMKKSYYCSQSVIDLEESDERMSDRYAKREPVSKRKHELQGSIFSDPIIPTCVKKNLFHEVAESSSFQEYSECCQEHTSCSEGIRDSQNHASSNDLSSKMQHFTSQRRMQLDLNKAHIDDSSCCSDDHMVEDPSRISSEGGSDAFTGSIQNGTCPTIFQIKDINELSDGASDMHEQDNLVNLGLVDLNRKAVDMDVWTRNSLDYGITGSEPSLPSPESVDRPPISISEDHGCCGGDHKSDSVELNSKLSSESSTEKSEVENAILSCTDQSQNAFQDEQGKSPDSYKSGRISDNDPSSPNTENSATTSGVFNQYLKTQSESKGADVLTDGHERRTSDNSDLNNGYNNKEESGEVDVLIQEAAELLIHISSDLSACNQDCHENVESKDIETERKVRPLCSFDSFELIAINLTESDVDDNSVSSKPYDVNDIEAKEFGLKLKRGRRMKDFQREILPTLSSLSRHEILEDINIMEGVLRSREYRKMRGKMAVQGQNWSAPVRSRRSRLSYAGGRNYS